MGVVWMAFGLFYSTFALAFGLLAVWSSCTHNRWKLDRHLAYEALIAFVTHGPLWPVWFALMAWTAGGGVAERTRLESLNLYRQIRRK